MSSCLNQGHLILTLSECELIIRALDGLENKTKEVYDLRQLIEGQAILAEMKDE